MKKCVCLAYYGDNRFLGWYGDSFGTITKCPKIYSFTLRQLTVIHNNFKYKLSKIYQPANIGTKINPDAGIILDKSLDKDSNILKDFKEISLRIIECPFYDGTNPNFNTAKYNEELSLRKDTISKLGINNLIGNERIIAIETFNKLYPTIKCDNYIYADYKQVNDWAQNEPIIENYLGVITTEDINILSTEKYNEN